MSDQNMAIVQEGQARFNRGDLEGALELFAPEMEWDTTQAVPDGQIYRGRTAILEFWRSIPERWLEFRIEVDEWIETGPETILALGRLIGRGTESGVPVEDRWDQVWRFRAGRVIACEHHTDRERARRAAGL